MREFMFCMSVWMRDLLTMATTTPFGGSVALLTLLVLIISCVKQSKKVYNRIIRIDFKNKV